MVKKTTKLNTPYGGVLVDLLANESKRTSLKDAAVNIESITLSNRSLCDLEMLAIGAFSPLQSFMNQDDYKSVLKTMRLESDILFPIPITLPVAKVYIPDQQVALRDGYGNLLAIMTVDDCYQWDQAEFAKYVIGSYDLAHPLIAEMQNWGTYNISGHLEVLSLPTHKDFNDLRLTPMQVREKLLKLNSKNVVAFQTRNPLHRAHEELTKRAAEKIQGTLLLHPVVGMTKPGDVDHITRVRCYKALIDNHYQDHHALLSLLPLAMRMAGPREALWHAIIRRNYGASHFIVGRDHAGPGKNSQGKPFYGAYDAQGLTKQHEKELGVEILTFNEVVYIPKDDQYVESHEVPAGQETFTISGTQVREEYLAKDRPLPEWFTRPVVASILRQAYTVTTQQGFCLWLTGLSGSGKSTVAQAIEAALHERGRKTTILDGDVVRENLSEGLGFSKKDRQTNISRVGFVASQVVYHNGIAICALISPYEAARQSVRKLFGKRNFIEIYISTPLEVCSRRDPKGYYTKARQGKLKQFTGIDDEYEVPRNAEIIIDTSQITIEEAVKNILEELITRGFID